jgi:hypothetical protein
MEAKRIAAAALACPNCGAPTVGAWCPGCGQETVVERGAFVRTVRRQWQRIRHTLVALLVHPGQLTAEFRDGQRARSISPWRLAFNVLTVFFLLSFVTTFGVANFPKQDPSGWLAEALSSGAQQAKLDEPTFIGRVDRRFNGIFTLMQVLVIASSALVARLTHLRRRQSWNIDLVFALHFTTWALIANLVYFIAMRLLGLSLTYRAQTSAAGTTLLGLILLWQFSYVFVAFGRVYGDGSVGAAAKATVMVGVGFIVANALAIFSFFLAIQTALRTP